MLGPHTVSVSLPRWVILQIQLHQQQLFHIKGWSGPGHNHTSLVEREYNLLNQICHQREVPLTTITFILGTNWMIPQQSLELSTAKWSNEKVLEKNQATPAALKAKVFQDAALHPWILSYKGSPAAKITHKMVQYSWSMEDKAPYYRHSPHLPIPETSQQHGSC